MNQRFKQIKKLLNVVAAHMSDPDGIVHVENLTLKVHELEATLSPRPIEEAPEEWFDGRKMLVFDEEYEEWLIAIHVSNIGWAIYEHGKHFTLLYQVTKLLPLPSMDGGKR